MSEEFTNLDYLDNTGVYYPNYPSIYKDTDLHLWRTFNPGYWNTLVLPVSLTKEQFTKAFGSTENPDDDAKLVEIKKITDTKLVFQDETVDASGNYLKAYKPYLIWTKKAKGDQPKQYGALLGSTGNTIEISVPRNHFLIEGVTLEANHEGSDEYGLKVYDFANAEICNVNGMKYTVVNSTPAYDETEGAETYERYATFYGTLCQTYEGTHILEGRPDLADGSSYYMGSGSNFYRRAAGRVMGQKGFRCWFTYTDNRGGESAAAKYTIEYRGISDDVNSIEDIFGDGKDIFGDGEHRINQYSDAIYNLNGQKVGASGDFDKLPAGIYIVNGRKMAKK